MSAVKHESTLEPDDARYPPRGVGRFSSRHIGPSDADIAAMLAVVGVGSVDELIEQTVPASIRLRNPLRLPPAMSEAQALAHLKDMARANRVAISLIGMGYHGTILPPVIQRNILENPAWYTAYTPYQAEISQGRLEAVFNFQTLVCELTGLDVANASLLDEATAAAEAMALARRVSKSTSNRFFADANTHPQILDVLRTRAEPLGWEIITGSSGTSLVGAEYFGGMYQYPGSDGTISRLEPRLAELRGGGGIAIVCADPLALTLLKPPGELGADIAVGSMQRFGVPMGFGGPHAAYMAVRSKFQRDLPGRLVGLSRDPHGDPAYRLTLQTREQHIRRDKATSNICTSQVLLAIIASMYAVYHGPAGLQQIARAVNRHARVLAAGLRRLGFELISDSFFDTISVITGGTQSDILDRAVEEGINLRTLSPSGPAESPVISIALDETVDACLVERLWRCFGGTLRYSDVEDSLASSIGPEHSRSSAFLRQDVFNRYRSETEMLRYLRRLSDRDLALDRTMIPLGSCTMKLNATAEMLPMTWPEFSELHPYVPADQARGYQMLADGLSGALCEISGFDAVSLQPNSGAQGEYAGLLAIRRYHHSRGESIRDVCLIPSSAHGTNPASAVMAGMKVVIVKCDSLGNVDLVDLAAKCTQHAARLAAIMVTYPSTHGVFEERIRDLCELVHAAGGQVYIDGANLNAQVGLARPGDYGADVSHFNLHKTFCIPHGGGGPGVGPIGVKAHLAPFLPGHGSTGNREAGAVAAAALGSASILPISYMYIALMGADGLRRASEIAILSANYVAARLQAYFPVLYRNERGRVAHECIIDPRAYKDSVGVTVDDIAKRLIDFGFHAPTMSFPVAGTLMIEPTESESKSELDRFCEAMIAIRAEIRALEDGEYAVADSPLRRAPHTVKDVLSDAWSRPYSRTAAALPLAWQGMDKYWAPVGRVDNAFGDRNLVCSCPPPASYGTPEFNDGATLSGMQA